jgi:hypothetical protein
MITRMLQVLVVAVALQQSATPGNVPGEVLTKDVVIGTAGVVSFTFTWPEAPNPHWSIEVYEDGTGRYDRLEGNAKASAQTRRNITLSKPTLDRVRAPYKTVASGNCETRLKHLAQTGEKHIAYTMAGSDAWSSCTFNYSDDKSLMSAAEAFQAIAETMQTGEMLEHTHRFDRLGLDAQLVSLTAEAKDGRAIELQNIAPVLRAIVDDDRVIDRARRMAARLLQDAVPSPANTEPTSPR